MTSFMHDPLTFSTNKVIFTKTCFACFHSGCHNVSCHLQFPVYYLSLPSDSSPTYNLSSSYKNLPLCGKLIMVGFISLNKFACGAAWPAAGSDQPGTGGPVAKHVWATNTVCPAQSYCGSAVRLSRISPPATTAGSVCWHSGMSSVSTCLDLVCVAHNDWLNWLSSGQVTGSTPHHRIRSRIETRNC